MRLMLVLCPLVLWGTRLEVPPPVKEPGDMFSRGHPIDLDRVIPANERVILCLAQSNDEQRIFGGTTGRAAHLVVYNIALQEAHSLARLPGGIGLSYALIALPDGTLIAGTQADPTGTAVATDPKQ